MRLILTKNQFKFNGQHCVQTPRIALQWAPICRLLSRSFSRLTLRNNHCMRAIFEEIYWWYILSVDSSWNRNQQLYWYFANSSHSTIKLTLVKTNCFDDVSLIRKRWSSSGEHSLRSVVNAVRYVVRMNSRACLCYQRKKLLSRDRRVFSFNFFFAAAYFHFALVAARISHILTTSTKFSCCFSTKKIVSFVFYLSF